MSGRVPDVVLVGATHVAVDGSIHGLYGASLRHCVRVGAERAAGAKGDSAGCGRFVEGNLPRSRIAESNPHHVFGTVEDLTNMHNVIECPTVPVNRYDLHGWHGKSFRAG